MDIKELLTNSVAIAGILYLLKSLNHKRFYLKVIPSKKNYYLIFIPLCLFFTKGETFLIIVAIIIGLSINHLEEFKILKLEFLKKAIQCLVLSWPILFLFSILSISILGEMPEQDIVRSVKKNQSINLLKIIFSTTVISPIVEEIFFRKILYGILKKYIGVFFGIIFTSILFSFIHLNLYSFFTLFILSIILCFIYEQSKTIYVPILVHSIFNLFMIFLIKL